MREHVQPHTIALQNCLFLRPHTRIVDFWLLRHTRNRKRAVIRRMRHDCLRLNVLHRLRFVFPAILSPEIVAMRHRIACCVHVVLRSALSLNHFSRIASFPGRLRLTQLCNTYSTHYISSCLVWVACLVFHYTHSPPRCVEDNSHRHGRHFPGRVCLIHH